MPRKYTLGRRTDSVEATRARIVTAAAATFAELGFDASILEIARRAGVAPGTVRYRFPDREDLIAAAVAHILVEIDIPSPAILDGARDIDERLTRTATALFGFYRRTAHYYPLFAAARERSQALRDGQATFDARFTALLAATLGEHGDADAFRVASAMLGPHTEGAFRTVGMPDAGPIVAEMLGAWLRRRASCT